MGKKGGGLEKKQGGLEKKQGGLEKKQGGLDKCKNAGENKYNHDTLSAHGRDHGRAMGAYASTHLSLTIKSKHYLNSTFWSKQCLRFDY